MTSIRFIIASLFFLTAIAAGQRAGIAGEPAMAVKDRDIETRSSSLPERSAASKSSKDTVVVAIRPNAQLDSRVIRLIDVASVTGGDPTLREKLKALDLEDGLAPGETVTILPPQIEFRMRLAGIDVDKVVVKGSGVRVSSRSASARRGSEQVTSTAAMASHQDDSQNSIDLSTISSDDGPLEREIIQAAKTCVLNKLPWPADAVDIRLQQPLGNEIRQVESAAGYQCVAEIRSAGPPVGRVQVRVVANARKKSSFDVAVAFDVRHMDDVVMTTKAVDRGHVLTANDLYVERKDVTDLSEYSSMVKDLVGSTTKRSYRALMTVKPSDLEGSSRAEKVVMVHRRDQVRMVARVGVLSVTATGEALQDGKVGETIRLRNVDSNKQVQGRVISAEEVEISF